MHPWAGAPHGGPSPAPLPCASLSPLWPLHVFPVDSFLLLCIVHYKKRSFKMANLTRELLNDTSLSEKAQSVWYSMQDCMEKERWLQSGSLPTPLATSKRK